MGLCDLRLLFRDIRPGAQVGVRRRAPVEDDGGVILRRIVVRHQEGDRGRHPPVGVAAQVPAYAAAGGGDDGRLRKDEEDDLMKT